MNITEQQCKYFIRHKRSMIIKEDSDYNKGYYVSWTKNRPVCTPDEVLYVINKCYIVAFTKQEALNIIGKNENEYRDNRYRYCQYIEIINYVKAQTGKALISMEGKYKTAFYAYNVSEDGIAVILFDVKDMIKIVTRTKREEKLQQELDDRMSKRKLIDTIFKAAIDNIAEKYGLEYNPEGNCLTLSDPNKLYDLIDLVLKEVIAKDFAQIGLQINPRMERSKSITTMSKIIDLDDAEIVEVTSEE